MSYCTMHIWYFPLLCFVTTTVAVAGRKNLIIDTDLFSDCE